MPDEKKSNRKNDPKEQRRSRRRNTPQIEKKDEKQPTPINKEAPIKQEAEISPKVTVPETSNNEPPGPEFYKSLKRETDEILKITEEANLKYKKKEIQSNWAKYEMPIESYNEIDEQENMGADYETLIQAPLSVGGHFQFKHEKSWDINTGPSLYDNYFEIDMDNLAIALSTVPFYERNCIDQSIFNETEVLNMNNRATKFKQKYYRDKSYTTPELDAEEKILNSLSKSDENNEMDNPDVSKNIDNSTKIITKLADTTKDSEFAIKNIKNENMNIITEKSPDRVKNMSVTTDETKKVELICKETELHEPDSLEIKLDENKDLETEEGKPKHIDNIFIDDIDDIIGIVEDKVNKLKIKPEAEKLFEDVVLVKEAKEVPEVASSPVKEKEEPTKNPVIESPEDLEKWLDDFLDG